MKIHTYFEVERKAEVKFEPKYEPNPEGKVSDILRNTTRLQFLSMNNLFSEADSQPKEELRRGVLQPRVNHHTCAQALGASRALHIPQTSLQPIPTLNGMLFITMTTAPPSLWYIHPPTHLTWLKGLKRSQL